MIGYLPSRNIGGKVMPKVSVLIPVYNAEKYLCQCLNSVINQTLKDIEIICINDGSTDNSLEIMKEFQSKDDRIGIIDKANTGYGHSMNLGILNSSGKYIGIIESDDFAELDMFETLYNIADKHDTNIVKCNYYQHINGEDYKTNIPPNVKYDEVINPYDYPNVFGMQATIWSAIYNKEFIVSNGISFLETSGASYQDTSFNFKVWACANRAYLIDKPLIHYRLDNENQSVKSKSKVYCICDEYHEIESFLNNNFDKKAQLTSLKNRLKYGSYIWNLQRIAPENSTNFRNLMACEFIREFEEGNINRQCFNEQDWDLLMRIINQERR
jgi:glycosyltransferase involved in cell wall biosynthesis